MDLGLDGKVAVVTGASRGLGFAAALKLSLEGASVAINSRSKENLMAAKHAIEIQSDREVFSFEGDVTNPETPERLIEAVITKFNRLDILITNSGGPKVGKFESFSDSDWQEAIDQSFTSHLRLIRSALPYLRKSVSPSVLSITSISVKQPMEGLILSNSIRLATIGLIKSLALELGHEGIRFNSILPSSTDTERIKELSEKRAKINQTSLAEEREKLSRSSALGRIATPEEFANAAVFLVSPAASFLTGVMLAFDGGSYKATF